MLVDLTEAEVRWLIIAVPRDVESPFLESFRARLFGALLAAERDGLTLSLHSLDLQELWYIDDSLVMADVYHEKLEDGAPLFHLAAKIWCAIAVAYGTYTEEFSARKDPDQNPNEGSTSSEGAPSEDQPGYDPGTGEDLSPAAT